MRAVAEVGEYIIDRDKKDPLSIFVMDPNVKYVVSILLNKKENVVYEFSGVNLEEYDSSKEKLYLYRRGDSSGTDVTPSHRLTKNTKDGITKALKRLLRWFSNMNFESKRETDSMISEIYECLRHNEDEIINKIGDKLSNMNSKEGILLIVKIKENGEYKYIGEIEFFKKILEKKSVERYYIKKSGESLGKNALCSICLEIKDEVYGLTSDIYKFYNLDKVGFAPSFNVENGWKLYPVCLDCALKLEEGKKFIEKMQKKLRFYVSGKKNETFPYYIIPKFLKGIEKEEYEDILNVFEEYTKNQSSKSINIKHIENLVGEEDLLLQLLKDKKDVVTLNFIFYKREQQAFRILLAITDILPSRLRLLYDTKKRIDKIEIFADKNLKLNFGILRRIFPKASKKEGGGTFDKYFLDTVNKIFTLKPVDFKFVLKFLTKEIRNYYKSEENYKKSNKELLPLRGLMFFMYLKELGILKDYGGEDEMKDPKDVFRNTENSMREIVDRIFTQFSDFFNYNAKKAIFLEGVLTQKLLNIQFRERKSIPFIKKLNGLKLDEKKVRALLPAVQGKLMEYDANYYKDLEELISEYFVASGDSWNMSNDEISFFFVLGMNLADKFKSKDEEKRGEENE